MIVFIVINIILFPLLFYTNGGVYSGMPIWLAFGLIYPWMVSEGAMCIVMFILNALVTVGCFATQYFFPEWFVAPAEDNLTQWIVLDSVQVALVVAVILGMAIKYQAYVFDRQQAKMLKQEEQLRQAMKLADKSNAAKTDFLVRMSHEIRTPINAVLGMDEMILRESREEDILQYAQKVETSSNMLLFLIKDAIDFSKIESGSLEMLPVR